MSSATVQPGSILPSSSSFDSFKQESLSYQSTMPVAPSSNMSMTSASGADQRERDRLRSRNEELQALADKQAQDLRRRNDELLDLQRNHEAFREKFILFREGMRTKNDETDARFKQLQEELQDARNEATAAKFNGAGSQHRDGTSPAAEARILELEGQQSKLQAANKQLQQELAAAKVARAGSGEFGPPGDTSAVIIKDLRSRIENQAEYIRSQNSKMTDLEQRLDQGQDQIRGHMMAAEDLKAQRDRFDQHSVYLLRGILALKWCVCVAWLISRRGGWTATMCLDLEKWTDHCDSCLAVLYRGLLLHRVGVIWTPKTSAVSTRCLVTPLLPTRLKEGQLQAVTEGA